MTVLLRLPEVTKMLGCAQNTVYKMVEDGRLPPPVRTGGVVRWWQHEIEEALEYDKKLVTTRAAMEWLQVSRGTLRRMVEDGRVPPPVRRGGTDHWLRDDLEAAIAAARDPEPEVQADAVSPFARAAAEKIRRQIALASQEFDDAIAEHFEELNAGVQRQRVVLDLVTEADGQRWLDVRSGQEHLDAFGVVIALPQGPRRMDLVEALREVGYSEMFDPASGGVEPPYAEETSADSCGEAVARC